IYKDLEAVEIAFRRLVNLVPRRGRIVAFEHGESIEHCVSQAFCPVERYGSSPKAAWRVTDLSLEASRTRWSVLRDGEPWAEFEFSLAGEYNVWNATAAAAMAAGYGICKGEIGAALKTVKRLRGRLRDEERGNDN